MGYKNRADVVATRIVDDKPTNIAVKDLHLFSSGAFSNVYRGQLEDNEERREIVIKKTWNKKDKVDRVDEGEEVKILKMLGRLHHKNIVRLLYTYRTEFTDNYCYSLIFEFLPMTLYQYLKLHRRRLAMIEIKMLAWQMFRGQFHLQRANICHRDMKPQNMLVDPQSGLLKISDFGASTTEVDKKSQPSYHVTRYYRPPELLLGSQNYGTEIDTWSVGCVFGEMLRGAVLFLGSSTADQFEKICLTLGLPKNDDIEAFKLPPNSKYPEYKKKFNSKKPTMMPWAKTVPLSATCSHEALDLLTRILVYKPQDRLSGQELLLDKFWMDLFKTGVTRPDGQLIHCLSIQDLNEVRAGDMSMTASMSGSKE